jgi:hypothetical protein
VKRAAALVAALIAPAAQAEGLALSGSLETWMYGSAQAPQGDGPLNPLNRVARVPQSQALIDTRAQVQGRADSVDFTLRLRSVEQAQRVNGELDHQKDTYLTQGYVRARPWDGWTVSAGRMLLTWGAGYLRSPSNPFYYDAGRTQPLRELSGIDAASVLYSGKSWSLQALEVFASGHTSGSQAENFSGSQTGRARFNQTHLLKFDWRAENWLASAIAAGQDSGSAYVGGYAQWTLDDAWMVYAEAGNGRRPNALLPNGTGAPFTLGQPSPRASTALAGAGYTLENGQNFNFEYLYDGHGYSRDGETAYFDAASRAAALPAPAGPMQSGLAAADAPVLLARHYLGLIWQSNPQENTHYWRALATRNLTDNSMQWNAYAEKNLNPHLTLFVNATVNSGGSRAEYSALMKRSVNIGAKIFIF